MDQANSDDDHDVQCSMNYDKAYLLENEVNNR